MWRTIKIDEEAFLGRDVVGAKAYSLGLLYRYDSSRVSYGFSIVPHNTDTEQLLQQRSDLALQQTLSGLINDDQYYAVRSSATYEDGSRMSFAGQFDSYLGIRGLSSITDAILRCFQSFANLRAAIYKGHHKHSTDVPANHSVFVQEMVFSSKAGVLFTQHPVTSDDVIVINSSYGLGSLIVEGRITPDAITVLKSDLTYHYQLGTKRTMAIITASGVEVISVPPANRQLLSLTDDHIKELAHIGIDLEDMYAQPLDIEWAIFGNKIYLLQMRPITRPRQQ
jgi:phosphoenolpyruvate synthase/pyruvate phosphate dikinase